MPDPGDLSERITIEQEVRVADAYGGADSSWSTLATVWALVQAERGGERSQVAEIEAPAMFRFTIRRRTDVTEAMRINWGGALYNIRTVQSVPARELYMQILAERGVAV